MFGSDPEEIRARNIVANAEYAARRATVGEDVYPAGTVLRFGSRIAAKKEYGRAGVGWELTGRTEYGMAWDRVVFLTKGIPERLA